MKNGKPAKKQISKTVKILLVILALVLVLNIIVVAAVMNLPESNGAGQDTQPTGNQLQQQNTEPSQVTDPTNATDPVLPEVQMLEMPYLLENGKLTVESVFTLDGLNPDCDNAEAFNVVGVLLRNTSEEHLSSLELYLTAPDGTVMEFAACDIPAGMSVMMFSLDNLSMEGEPGCTKLEYSAAFEAQSPLMSDQVDIQVEGMTITVKNISGEDLPRITVYCHSVFAESCYGGITYQYVIDSLPAGESATVTALDCYLGLTEVVRIDIGE